MPLPTPDVAPARLQPPRTDAAVKANIVRGRWLSDLAEARTTVAALLLEAASVPGHPLRRITLTRLLAAIRGTSQKAQLSTLTRTIDLVGVAHVDLADGPTRRRFTVGWLVAEGTAGKRVRVLAEVLNADRGKPWPGFPLASDPRNRKHPSGGGQ